jgi:serine/threonine protein phosphatase PrpC
MSICPNCKAVNPDNYQFCQSCGTKLNLSANIVEDEDIQPVVVTTKPIDLDSILGELKTKVEQFRSSQSATDTDDLLEELHIESTLEEVSDVSSETSLETLISETSISESSVTHSSTYLQNVDITHFGKSEVGMQRDRNEDDFAMIFQTRSINGKSQISDRSHRGVFVLCDGMGGHDGGEVASAIAVNSIIEQFLPFWIDTLPGKKKLNEIICNANQAIFDRNESEQRHSLSRMGTTLVMLALHDLDMVIAHIGDSRIYKITNTLEPKLEQLTRDHEVLNQLLDLGMEFENAITRSDAHQLTQALGPNSNDRIEPSIQSLTLSETTLFLLCSDGLCDNDVIENNWRSHLLPILNQEINLQTGLDNLIDLGNHLNGHDNLTAILILCDLESIAVASLKP